MRGQSYKTNNSQHNRFRGGETKGMKKKLSSLLVLALVFTMLAPAFAFAAIPSDVKNTNYEEAVAKLVSLGVLNGYPDGTFKPENTITRAEFAKVVAYAAGFATAAEYLGAQDTQFSDVKANGGYGWASGYIAVAASKGYLKGYPDGTFKPANTVTFAEVVTVLLRVLGYNDNLIGSWPSNYIIQADSLNLLDDVDFKASQGANRGSVAVLTSATLDQNLVRYDKDSDTFFNVKDDSDNNVTLLSKSFKAALKNAYVVSPTLGGDDKDQVSLAFEKYDANGNVTGYDFNSYTASDLYITGDLALADIWGNEVVVLLDGSKVKFIKSVQDSDDVVTGAVDASTATKITVDEDEYTFETNAKVYFNGTPVEDGSDIVADATTSVKLFLNGDGNVRLAIANKYDVANAVVTTLGSKNSLGAASISYTTQEEASQSVKIDKDTKITVNGDDATYEDLEKNMIISFVKNANNIATKLDVVSNTVQGKVTTVYSSGKIVVDGTTYETLSLVSVTPGKEYVLYFAANGKVAYATSVEAADTDFVGVLAEIDNYRVIKDGRLGDYVTDLTIVTTSGEVVTKRAATPKDDQTEEWVSGDLGQVFEFVLNGDGEVKDKGETVDTDTTTVVNTSGLTAYALDINTSTGRLTINNVTKLYNSNTVVFDLTDFTGDDKNADDIKVVNVADLKDGMFVKAESNATTYTYLIVTDNNTNDADQLSAVSGLYSSAYSQTVLNADDTRTTKYYVELNVDGTKATYELTEPAYKSLFDADDKAVYAKDDLLVLQDTNGSNEFGKYDVVLDATDTNDVVTIAAANLTGVTTSNKTFVDNNGTVDDPATANIVENTGDDTTYGATSDTNVFIVTTKEDDADYLDVQVGFFNDLTELPANTQNVVVAKKYYLDSNEANVADVIGNVNLVDTIVIYVVVPAAN